ncbi:MAG: WD40 repeat domain-containing protein [Gemmataceae bacterium]|nr:WD40 repeat domain-containing protein [Gemmataceae bacterium]MCI0738232.1 WD40 repeat domain-containing protein [Gemmataceae bacterium]
MRYYFALAFLGGATCLAQTSDTIKGGPAVRALAFSPDGKFLAASSSEPEQTGHATVWELSSGKLCFAHQEPKGIPAAAFAPDGKRLIFGNFNENAVVVDAANWKIERRLPGHGKAARGLAFTADGKTLAVTSYDGYIRLWDVPTWTVQKTLEDAHTGWVYAAAFSKDGKTLASASADNTAKLWDLETGKCLHTFKHDSIIRRILFTPDDRHVAYTSWDGSLAIRDRASGKWVVDLLRYGSGDDVAITRDGKMLAVAASSGALIIPIDLSPPDQLIIAKLRQLITAWDDDDIAVRDKASRDISALGVRVLPLLHQAEKEARSPEVRLRARLARASIGALELRPKLRHPEGEIQSVAFAPDGRSLATGGPDGIVRLWDVATGQEIRLLRQFAAGARIPTSEY